MHDIPCVGWFARAFVPLFCRSPAVIETRSSTYRVIVVLGILIGSPISGSIYGNPPLEGNWLVLPTSAGLCLTVAAVLTIYSIIHLRKLRNIPDCVQKVHIRVS